MKIQRFEMDDKGIIELTNCTFILSYGLIKDKPVVWGLVDLLSKSPTEILIVKKTGEDIDTTKQDLVYTISQANDRCEWHIFRKISKFASSIQFPKGGAR